MKPVRRALSAMILSLAVATPAAHAAKFNNVVVFAAATGISIALAVVSKHLLEHPIRTSARLSRHPLQVVGAGLALGGLASAAIDVSDGLLADLGHICEMSGCGAVIDVERVPLSAEILSLLPLQEALTYALGGGDDYELCFTAPPAQAGAIEAALEASGTLARRIGQLVAGNSVTCRRDGESFTPAARGYKHF